MDLNYVYFVMLSYICSACGDPFEEKLAAAQNITDDVLAKIFSRWKIDKFPNFLSSATIPKHSWDFMKMKFREKILHAEVLQRQQNFTICFTGSSVTAGHDSPFNLSFAPLTGYIMRPVFKALNVHLMSPSAAIGNNPCFPYDICVNTFCGKDADMVHWEQTYNCGFSDSDSPTVEQFIRQASLQPTHPIIVLSDSGTKNW